VHPHMDYLVCQVSTTGSELLKNSVTAKFAKFIFHAVSTLSVIRFPAASRLRILESANGSGFLFRVVLAEDGAQLLEISRFQESRRY
jgi:hypothetical protein